MLKGWKEILPGALIIEVGNTIHYHTGTWRSQDFIWDEEKCTHCLLCWAYCPDGAIIVKEGKVHGIDERYCKGCGLCAKECPKNAIRRKE